QNHRDAPRQQQNREEVPHLCRSHPVDYRIGRWPFHAAVPGEVVVDAVAVPFSVCLVVLRLIRDGVLHRETVVDRDEVDAVLRSLSVLVDIGASADASRHRTEHPRVTLDELPDVVTEAPVPLGPPIAWKVSDLIQPCSVPRFCNYFAVCQCVVELYLPDERWVRERSAVLAARKDGPLVEPETIHVHLLDPIAQAIDHELLRNRVIRIECISRAAVVQVP